MRSVLLLSLVLGLAGAAAAQQPPATAKPAGAAPQTQKPAPAQPQTQKPAAAPPQTQKTATAPPETQKPAASTQKPQTARRPAQPAARSGLAITVTDPRGATISGVGVELMGPTSRNAETNTSGQINFPGLQAGTYRIRFSGEDVITLERDVTVRAGQVTDVDVTLSPAPPPPAAPPTTVAAAVPERDPEPEVVTPPVGPKGMTQILSLVDLLEAELVRGNQPRKDTLVACSGNTRSMLVQLNEPQATRVYDGAEALYYVIGGEGTIQIDGRDMALEAGRYAALPRGTSHALTRRGRRPLVLLAVLSGEPCEQSK